MRFDYGSVVPWVRATGGGARTRSPGPTLVASRARSRSRGEDLRDRRPTSRCEPASASPFVLRLAPVAPAPRPAGSTIRTRRSSDDRALVARLGGPLHATTGEWRERGGALADHAQGAHLRADRRASSPRRPPRCPRASAACATGTTATAGCATRRFTLYALMLAGYREEAAAWRDWLLRAVAGDAGAAADHVRRGGRAAAHRARARLAAGLRGLAPGADRQRRRGASSSSTSTARSWTPCTRPRSAACPIGRRRWDACSAHCSTLLESDWREPDEGIWEVRGRAPALHPLEGDGLGRVRPRGQERSRSSGSRARSTSWRALRDEIHAEVCDARVRRRAGQLHPGLRLATSSDASLLMLPLVGLPAGDDPRMIGTVDGDRARADARRLRAALRHRDRASTGCRRARASFLACSFWLADNLRAAGPARRGTRLFERLLALRNDVGLLSEEYDPVAKRQLGNFPQAFVPFIAFVNSSLSFPHPGQLLPGPE